MLGKTLIESRFGSQNKLSVLGVTRPGADETFDLKETRLQFGDTLLVQGTWQNILALKKKRRDFIVMGQPETMLGAPNRQKAPIAFIILAGMLALMISGLVPVATAGMLAALVTVLSGCLTIDEAYESVDLFLIPSTAVEYDIAPPAEQAHPARWSAPQPGR